jgi:hypothetical protein
MTTAKVTGTLRKAGFKASKVVTGMVNGVYTKYTVEGYAASVIMYGAHKGAIGIETCAYKDRGVVQELIVVLQSAGFTANERINSDGMGTGVIIVR